MPDFSNNLKPQKVSKKQEKSRGVERTRAGSVELEKKGSEPRESPKNFSAHMKSVQRDMDQV